MCLDAQVIEWTRVPLKPALFNMFQIESDERANKKDKTAKEKVEGEGRMSL